MPDDPTTPSPRSFTSIPRRSWAWLKQRHGTQGTWLVILLTLALAGFVSYIATAENPWDRKLPEKLAEKAKLTFRDVKVLGLWGAAAGNAVVCVLLLLTARWWANPAARSGVPARSSAAPAAASLAPRWFWGILFVAVAIGAWERYPRLSHSLGNDEEQAMRKFVWGEYLRQDDGQLELKSLNWDYTLYYTITGNNHVVHSAAARLFLNAWQSGQPGPWETFSETAIRLEPLIVGLASFIVLALLGRVLGFPVTGLAGAFLLALHPWHLRYSVEARGYSGHLFCVLLALLFLALAFRDGHRWRWWLGYGAAQALYLIYYAGGVYFAAGMNAALFIGFLAERDFLALRRWLFACVTGAMAFFQILGPTLPKIGSWMDRTGSFSLPADFTLDLWSHLVAGIPYHDAFPELHLGLGLKRWMGDQPLVRVMALGVVPLLAVAGMGLLAVRTRFGRYAAGGFLAAITLVTVQLTRNPVEFYSWYLFFLLAGLVLFTASVLVALEGNPAASPKRRAILASAAVLLVVAHAALAWKPLGLIRGHDRQPMRQAVAAVRGEDRAYDIKHEALLTASTGSGNGQLKSYDPRMRPCDTVEELDAVIAEARASGKPLAVYVCGSRNLKRKTPDLHAKLEDPSLFEKGVYLKGLEEYWGYQILHLKPAAPAP